MKRFGWFIVMGAMLLPWILMRSLGIHVDSIPTAFITGFTIAASAFLLTWASEAAERDFSGSFIIVFLALIAVLPEYAVDGSLTWSAGKDSTFAPYAIANMTGANRLLIGLGWSAVVIIFWMKTGGFWNKGGKSIEIPSIQRLDCGILALATAYAFIVFLKGFLAWYDGAILIGVFFFYLYRVARLPSEEVDIVGPARAISEISSKFRRLMIIGGILAYAAIAIYLSAEPFAHGLIETGKALNINEFLLVQWLAPVASEAPEFIVAVLFVLRLHAHKGLGILVSSEVNQLTLLIGSIPIIFMISSRGFANFPLDSRQSAEILLTAAQSLFAVTLLANLSISLKEAFMLMGLFILQLFIPSPEIRIWFAYGYISFAGLLIVFTFRRSFDSWKSIGKAMVHGTVENHGGTH